MYRTPKSHLATSAGALALAILSLLIVIAARSFAMSDIAADAANVKMQLRKTLSP
jgi:hypothetical protein